MKLIKSAGGVVVRKIGNDFFVLLLQKNDGWYLPKGRINKGEKPKMAALREVYEEAGISLNKLKAVREVGDISFIAHQPEDGYATRPKIVSFFLVETDQKYVRPLKKEGFIKTEWFEAKEAIRKVSFASNKIMIWKAIKILEYNRPKKLDTLIIAAGGEGKRIREYFKKIGYSGSKSLFPIKDKTLLGRLLDDAIKIGFNRIFVLSSFYTNEIKNFVEKYYEERRNIAVIDGGRDGKEKGAMHVLYLLKDRLTSPFIYTDCNLLYDPKLLKNLLTGKVIKDSLINIVASPKDRATTHLELLVGGKKIFDISARVRNKNKSGFSPNKLKRFFSLGVVVIDDHIFDLVPELNKIYDFDLVIEDLFKSKLDSSLELVGLIKYDEDWVAIHDGNDIDRITNKI